jgi:hypothetical protein
MLTLLLAATLLQGTTTLTATPAPNPLITPTFDGSGQTVEPCVLYVPNQWNGFTYWMAVAPYRFATESTENASILATNDPPGGTQKWVVPPGVIDPIIPFPNQGTFNSDQSIFLNSDGTMYLYYSVTDGKTKQVYVESSKDGWSTISARKVLLSNNIATLNPLVSTVLYDAGTQKYYLWFVDVAREPHQLNRWTLDTPDGIPYNQTVCTVSPAIAGTDLFEQNIVRDPHSNRIYGLVTLAKARSGGVGTTLHLLYSDDGGLNWTINPSNVLNPGPTGTWDNMSIYRSCLQPTADNLQGGANTYDIWFSADNTAINWHVGYASGLMATN